MAVLLAVDAGKKIKGRKRHLTVDTEGSPIVLSIHPADIQDRDAAVDVLVTLLGKAPAVSRVFADGGYEGPKLRAALARRGLPDVIEVVERHKGIREFTILPCRWVVERTCAWMGRCRRLAKDFERHRGELPGLGEAGGVPVSHAAGGAGVKCMNQEI